MEKDSFLWTSCEKRLYKPADADAKARRDSISTFRSSGSIHLFWTSVQYFSHNQRKLDRRFIEVLETENPVRSVFFERFVTSFPRQCVPVRLFSAKICVFRFAYYHTACFAPAEGFSRCFPKSRFTRPSKTPNFFRLAIISARQRFSHSSFG